MADQPYQSISTARYCDGHRRRPGALHRTETVGASHSGVLGQGPGHRHAASEVSLECFWVWRGAKRGERSMIDRLID